MGHQVAVPQDLSGIPDWIHGTINNPSSLYEMGPAGAALEGFMINWMLSKLDWFKGSDLSDFSEYPQNGSGILTHGGSIANLTALSAARAKLAPEAWTEGNPNDLVVIGPASAHYSISRALSIMGMGKKAFVPVPVDSNEIILTSHLERVFNEVKSQKIPLLKQGFIKRSNVRLSIKQIKCPLCRNNSNAFIVEKNWKVIGIKDGTLGLMKDPIDVVELKSGCNINSLENVPTPSNLA